MTLFLVSSLALLSGFSLALFVGAICLAVIAVDIKNTARDQMLTAVEQRVKAEKDAVAAVSASKAVTAAIEANSLPWFPKTDKLEARYENEAVDKMENPSYYSDMVDGLGGLR